MRRAASPQARTPPNSLRTANLTGNCRISRQVCGCFVQGATFSRCDIRVLRRIAGLALAELPMRRRFAVANLVGGRFPFAGGHGDSRVSRGTNEFARVLLQKGHAAGPNSIIGLFCLLSRKFAFCAYVWIRTRSAAARNCRSSQHNLCAHSRPGQAFLARPMSRLQPA